MSSTTAASTSRECPAPCTASLRPEARRSGQWGCDARIHPLCAMGTGVRQDAAVAAALSGQEVAGQGWALDLPPGGRRVCPPTPPTPAGAWLADMGALQGLWSSVSTPASEEGRQTLRAWLCVPLDLGTWGGCPACAGSALSRGPGFSVVSLWTDRQADAHLAAHGCPSGYCSPTEVQPPCVGRAGIFGAGAAFQRLGGGEALCGGRASGSAELQVRGAGWGSAVRPGPRLVSLALVREPISTGAVPPMLKS